jgi:hypothetical protein
MGIRPLDEGAVSLEQTIQVAAWTFDTAPPNGPQALRAPMNPNLASRPRRSFPLAAHSTDAAGLGGDLQEPR